jgi:ParB family transcriptional regulator, chromosome partitioning protein
MERRLGRGLGSLLGQSGAVEDQKASSELPIEAIRPNPHQPRKTFEPGALEELADSIRRHGVLQAIVVRPAGSGYELVSGERRLRASQLAGRKTIPASIRADITDDQMLELALVENLQRQDLDAIERATGYRLMMESLHVTQEQVAEKVGLKRATVANHLRLLDLPTPAQDAVRRGLISMGHARALLGLASPSQVLGLVERIAREDLSVRAVESLVRAQGGAAPTSPKDVLQPQVSVAPWVRELEERMREALGTKVQMKNNPGFKGQIVIEYFNRADLDRLCRLLAPRQEIE